MKHLFIINPVAGKGKGHEVLRGDILKAAAALNTNVEVYITKEINGAYYYTRDFLSKLPKASELRIYSCGGDGTLNEVVNGVVEFRHTHKIAVGCVPTGTGNDFVRNFENKNFTSMEDQILGETIKVDLIRFKYNERAITVIRYCVNMFNIGFDCEVVYRTSKLKKYPLLNGSVVYLAGIVVTLIKKKGTNINIEFDDGTIVGGELLMVSVGNGSYCGGGLKGLPKAKVDDGLMDISMVNNIPRRAFISLFSSYSKGTHLQRSGIDKILAYKQSKSLSIVPKAGSLRLCTDGEILETKGIKLEVEPLALDFIIPAAFAK